MANPFTPEQISQILEEFFKVVGTRQYIGARYVPIFGRKGEESIEWDNSAPYEPLTIVLYQGNSYTSRQYVPVGVEITNQEFWALTGNYNAQVEQYRRDVQAFDGRISANATAIDAEKTRAENAEQTLQDGINTNATTIDAEKTRAEGAEQTLQDGINTNATAIAKESADRITADTEIKNSIGFTSRSGDKIVVFSDSTFQTNPDINNGNVLQKSVVDWMKELAPGMTIDNRGVGGTRTSWLLNTLNSLGESDISDATYVIVAYGTNDWQDSVGPLKINKASTDTMDYMYGACLDRINALAPKANVICVTPAFLKSTSASKDKILNQNNTGNTIQSYSDVIEFEAHRRNMACLRLDYLMGINISNYQSRMVASTNDIWVHYNQDTNRRIATMLLNCIYGIAVPSYSCSYIDVTPASWRRCDRFDYYSLVDRSRMTTNTYTVSGLLPNTEYWITAFGGNVKLLCNDAPVLNCLNLQGIVQFTVTTDDAGTLTIANQDSSHAVNLMNTKLTYGRPNIYQGVYPAQSGFLEYGGGGAPFATVNLLNSLSIGYLHYTVDSLDTVTPIATIPSRFKAINNGFAIGSIAQTNGVGIAAFSGRIFKNQLYPNMNVSKVEEQPIDISCILISLDV